MSLLPLSPYLAYLCYIPVFGLLLFVAFGILFRLYNFYSLKKCTCTTLLHGKTVLITGASAGIGKEAAKIFASRGAKVILACRNKTKADLVADEIRRTTKNPNVFVKIVDTSSMSSVRSFGKEILHEEQRLDVLVLNAGIGGYHDKIMTKDDLEVIMATNHFGHFLLVNLLMGLIKRSKPSRIVVTSSAAQFHVKSMDLKNLNFDLGGYGAFKAYSLSKLCNVLMTKYLAVYLEGKGVTVNCFHPGYVKTEIFEKSTGFLVGTFLRWLLPFAARTTADGTHTLIHLVISKESAEVTGKYFVDCKIKKPSKLAEDSGLVKKVWEKSEDIVKLSAEELSLRDK